MHIAAARNPAGVTYNLQTTVTIIARHKANALARTCDPRNPRAATGTLHRSPHNLQSVTGSP